ncbi:MAG: lipoyl(octanoyl) transferase LipB [Myxococcota bacterium]
MAADLAVQWLGRLSFGWAERLQRGRRRSIIAGVAPEVLWLLEHDPVITLGRRGGEVLANPSIPVVATDRGGLATYHGPGQLVGYLLVDVDARRLGVRRLVEAIEDGLIAWLTTKGILADRRPHAPGVWVGDHKIAALGLHFSRGVSMHGFALNLEPHLAAYQAIVPCGFSSDQVTSVAKLKGGSWPVFDHAADVGQYVRDAIVSKPGP